MANRRMFSKEIIDSDIFLDMPLSTQALYFHLAMRADDDGFVNNPRKIARMIGSNDDDSKVLILGFESGVIVIKHWKLHNYIQKDRYTKTNYTEELAILGIKENKSYTMDTECVQVVDTGKVREGKVSKEILPFSFSLNVMKQLCNTNEEYKLKLKEFINNNEADMTYEEFYDSCEMKGYKYKNYKLTYLKWNKDNVKKKTTSAHDEYK